MSPSHSSLVAAVFALATSIPVVACGPSRTRDVAGDRVGRRWGARDAGAAPTASGNDVPAPPPEEKSDEISTGPLPHVLARANTRALAADETRVYYGDAREDAVFAIDKEGGEPTRIARRAPVAGSLALDGGKLSWIASPGNVVLRTDLRTSTTTTLKEGGIFVDVAASNGEVFIVEATGTGGTLHRVGSNGTAARLATFDALPRALAASKDDVVIATSTKLLRLPRSGGPVQTIASGAGFSSPQIEGEFVVVAANDASSSGVVIVRFPKQGGPAVRVGRADRRTPVHASAGELFFVAGGKPRLVAIAADRGRQRILSEADVLSNAIAMTADAEHVFVATSDGDDGLLLSIARATTSRPDGGLSPSEAP